MSRRHKAVKRKKQPDARYNSELIAHFINHIMRDGKKSIAERVVYGAIDVVVEKSGTDDPLAFVQRAVDNVKPRVEVKSRRVGGATYQVPIEVSRSRQMALALRWIIGFSKGRKGVAMHIALGNELLDAYSAQGAAVKKRDDTHKMAQANKAFAHYRW